MQNLMCMPVSLSVMHCISKMGTRQNEGLKHADQIICNRIFHINIGAR